MNPRTATHLVMRDKQPGASSLPDNGRSETDNSGEVEEPAYETVRRISATETSVENQEIGAQGRGLCAWIGPTKGAEPRHNSATKTET